MIVTTVPSGFATFCTFMPAGLRIGMPGAVVEGFGTPPSEAGTPVPGVVTGTEAGGAVTDGCVAGCDVAGAMLPSDGCVDAGAGGVDVVMPGSMDAGIGVALNVPAVPTAVSESG